MTENAGFKVRRGPASWAFIYMTLGFALAIEGDLIQMIPALDFPLNIVTYLLVGAATVWLFISSAGFQGALITMKQKYEDRFR